MHDTTAANAGALKFPCLFPLKVMGLNTDGLYPAVHAILKKHVPDLDGAAFTSRKSSGGKYLSITVTFTAHSRDQLNAIYQELNDHELVLMTL
jgi:putative lipoic acid-binding regulatory protein